MSFIVHYIFINYTAFKLIQKFPPENLPGDDWVTSFIRRHKLTTRKADNIKPERSSITQQQVDDYFTNLELELKDVPASNIFNFDETNFTNDPKKKTVRLNKIEVILSYDYTCNKSSS